MNCKFGHDTQCEVCGENAMVRMPAPSFPAIRKDANRGAAIEIDWKHRFGEAYDVEIQELIDSTIKGEVNGPTAWDGYLAAVTVNSLVKAQAAGAVEPIETDAAPAFYK